MKTRVIFRGFAALIVCFLAARDALAVNRFFITNRTLGLGTTGNIVPVMADVDQDTFGLSLHLQYDAAKIRVTAVSLGTALTPLSPEYSDGTITNSPGRVVYGVVFDTSGPSITKKLTAGAGKEIFKLTVDVVAAGATSVVLDLVNTAGNPSRLNVMTNASGDSVSPAPSLVDGTITLQSLAPVIQNLNGNSGTAGKHFFVVGLNFNQAGLAVQVCGKPAVFSLLGDNQTIDVTAPACTPGPAEVEVCTNFGCDSEPAGFTYDAGPQPPQIDSIIDNAGTAGKKFLVIGQGFRTPGFKIRVCGVDAAFTILGDDQTAEVTAPACGTTGFALLEACNDVGCDSTPNGFDYQQVGRPFVRGNANNDGTVDLSDAVAILGDLFLGNGAAAPCRDALDSNDSGALDITDAVFLLGFLFQGGPSIPAPYPAAGLDTTADPLPSC